MDKTMNLEQRYINRELSWLEFNHRVLEEAQDAANPLFERVKFAGIVSSNLDEFFMVRVASIWDQVSARFKDPDTSGLTPYQQMEQIGARAHVLVDEQYRTYTRALVPALQQENISLLKIKDLTKRQQDYLQAYYHKEVFPVLTPMLVDRSHPFPLIQNRSINIALLLKRRRSQTEPYFATVEVPSLLKRVVELPFEKNTRSFVLLEDLIKANLKTLFGGYIIAAAGEYRITRNADLGYDEEGAEDILQTIQQSLMKRKWGGVIRLEVEKTMPGQLLEILEASLEVPHCSIYSISGPLDLTFLFKIGGLPGYDALRFPAFQPQMPQELKGQEDIFACVSQQDILLHHPYDSFGAVTEFVAQASEDPAVLAIKSTLYRVSGQSPIVESLARAAANGKQVTVLVEIKARFDEENNILWARHLEQAGCHVIYSQAGLKTHCKILMVVRREDNGIKRYIHLGTGNYNDVTARQYADVGLLTANPYLAADAAAVFNMLTSYSQLGKLYKMAVSPYTLRRTFLGLIEQEAEHAANGHPARIIAKVNSLVDQEIIDALYAASQAGVKVDLIVRGICSLRPGVPGLSDGIRVVSIIGRFLEHSRIFYFLNQGNELVYLSSADWMERNLDRRVEVMFPLEELNTREKITSMLNVFLSDNVKARLLKSDGTYKRVGKGRKTSLESQDYFLRQKMIKTP